MSNEPQTDSDPDPPDQSSGWTLMTDLMVSSGRVQIPKKSADRHGFAVDDIVNAVLETEDERSIRINETPITTRRRISIPSHRLELHNLEGEYVDLWLQSTGNSL